MDEDVQIDDVDRDESPEPTRATVLTRRADNHRPVTAEDGETAWKRLFDRAEAYDVERATVRAALARRRADSTTAADAEDDDA